MDRHEEISKLLTRIKRSDDGADFLAYLEELDQDNYKAFKRCRPEVNDLHKGYAWAIDNLIKSFAECDKEQVPVQTINAFD